MTDVPTPVSADGNDPVKPTAPTAPSENVATGDGAVAGDVVPGAGDGAADDRPGADDGDGDEDGDFDRDGDGGDATDTLVPALGGVQGSSVGTLAEALSDTVEPAEPPGADTSRV